MRYGFFITTKPAFSRENAGFAVFLLFVINLFYSDSAGVELLNSQNVTAAAAATLSESTW